MEEYEEKFIVINKKHLDKMPAQGRKDFYYGLQKINPWLPDNKYYVCNQDEQYAEDVISLILENPSRDKKYEYSLKTWGGFFNKEFSDIHREKPGNYYFDTKEERDLYYNKLDSISIKLDAKMLASDIAEGFCLRDIPTLHRVTIYKGKEYHTKDVLFPGYDYESAKHRINYSWYPGCNDYPLGEGFDYNSNDYRVKQQWISGSFSVSEP